MFSPKILIKKNKGTDIVKNIYSNFIQIRKIKNYFYEMFMQASSLLVFGNEKMFDENVEQMITQKLNKKIFKQR